MEVILTPEEREILKDTMNKEKLTIGYVAKSLKISPRSLSNRLSGKYTFTPEQIGGLYELLGKRKALNFLRENLIEEIDLRKKLFLTFFGIWNLYGVIPRERRIEIVSRLEQILQEEESK